MTLWSAYGSSSQSRTLGGICEGKEEQEEEEKRRKRSRRHAGVMREDITDANVWIIL